MTHPSNPFIRGYHGLSIQRLLAITSADDSPPSYLPIHESQAHLPDEEVQLFPCIFSDRFALITEGQEIAGEIEDQCAHEGIVRTIVYAVTAETSGTSIHVGDTYSETAARDLVKNLSFETGHFSRCWEIHSGHVTAEALQVLETFARIDTPRNLLFEAFRFPDGPGIGCKLISTPWTDEHLDHNEASIYQAHLQAGLPESLVNLLHRAAQADTRILILDPDAPVLEGLPLYEH